MTLALDHDNRTFRSTDYFDDKWNYIDDSSERAYGWFVTVLDYRSPSSITTSDAFIPKTAFGKKLWSLRQKAIDSGMRLLSEDEIDAEMAARRGEIGDD